MTADNKENSRLSRRDFLKLFPPGLVALLFGSSLAACTSETEKPLAVLPPLSITFNNQSFLFNEIPEVTKNGIKKLLNTLPSIAQTRPATMVMPTESPFNWPENEIKPPQGELLSILNISANGFCHFQVPNGFGFSHFVIADNNRYLYVPTDEASYQSFANFSKVRVNLDQLALIQQLTRSLDWNSVPSDQQEYPLLFANETRFFRIDSNKQPQIMKPPGCRAFLETAVSKEGVTSVNPEQFSNLSLHDLQIATQILRTLLLASERFKLVGGSSGVPKQIPLFSPYQPSESLTEVKLENVDTIGFEARDPNLERDITAVETAFGATCSTLPKELPLAFKIWEQRTNDKGKIESRVRLVFMQSDGTISENWFYPPDKKDLKIGANIVMADLPNEVRVALKINEEGYQPIGIEQGQTKLFWDGEAYRVGVYNQTESNQVVFEREGALVFDGLVKALTGAQTGSIDHENFEKQCLDLTEWYYLLRNQGISEVGPAGLTLPEWVTKILHGMAPQDKKLTQTLTDNDYFLPLFSDTPLAELDNLNDALLVYLGERTGLALTLKNGWDWRQFRTKAQIQSFDGELHFADMLPLWKKGVFANVPKIGDVPVLKIGGNLIEALSVPYDPGQYSVIRGEALKEIRGLFRNLTFLYDSQPQVSGAQIGQVPVFDPEQKNQRRQQLAAILRSLSQF